jgi:hypothetical protein
MHIEQVAFEEVFDVQSARGDFSFRTRGKPRYGVNLHSGVIPSAGSTFAVAFGQAGNWDTVLGCRDLAGTEVRLRRVTWQSVLLATGDFIFLGPLCMIAGLVIGGTWAGAVLATLLLLAMGGVVVHGMRLNRAVVRALLAIGKNGDRPDDTGLPFACTGSHPLR